MNIFRRLAILTLVFTGIFSLHAQPVNVQQFQNTQQTLQLQAPPSGLNMPTNAPDLYQGENEDIGPQRILRLAPRPDYFNLFFDSQILYSGNANFSTGANQIGSSVFVNTVQAAFTPPEMKLGPGKMAATAGFVSQWYNYGSSRMEALDFDAQTAFVSARYNLDNWQLGFGGNYTRLLSQGSYAQTYSEWLPALTLQRIIPINDKLLFVVSDELDYHFSSQPPVPGTSTEINNRFDEAVNLTVSWQITRQLNLQPYYRYQYSNYRYNTLQTTDRKDILNSFGLTLTYYFNKNFSARAFINYNLKQSGDPLTPDYREVNGGIGANLNFNF